MHLSRFSRRRLLAGLGGLALVVLIPVGIAVGSGGAPTAVDDAYLTDTNTPLSQAAPGVLANDSDDQGQGVLVVDATSIVTGGATTAGGTYTLAVDGSFSYTPPNPTYTGQDTFTYLANDGDQPSSSSATVTITVDSRPVGVTESYSTDEDTPLVVGAPGVVGNDTDADNPGAGQTLTVSGHTDPAHGALSISGDGSFTYTPAADYNGPDSFTYTVSDGLLDATSATTVDLTVDPVNDPPSFTKGADQTVNEDAGAQTVPGWATAMSAGPSDESGQTLSFNVSNDNNPLFSVQPAVAANGTLSYTPAANANGSATVTVSLSDNGGGSEHQRRPDVHDHRRPGQRSAVLHQGRRRHRPRGQRRTDGPWLGDGHERGSE